MAKNFTGASCGTAQRLLLNAGAFFKNFDIENDTFDSAIEAGKGLGATQGGGTFAATPEVRQIEIDGSDPIPTIDGWKVTITANLLEISAESFKLALGTGIIEESSGGANGDKFHRIRARRNLDFQEDFIENITWVGMLSGSNEPVIIQVFNAMSTSGININVTPKGQAVLAVTFAARADYCKYPEHADYAPFDIYYPKTVGGDADE